MALRFSDNGIKQAAHPSLPAEHAAGREIFQDALLARETNGWAIDL